MREKDRQILRNVVLQENRWMRRALIYEAVLSHLGYNCANLMQANGEVLANIMLKPAEDIIRDCQMRRERPNEQGEEVPALHRP